MLQLAYVAWWLGAVSLLVAAGASWNVLRPASRHVALDQARLQVLATATVVGFSLSAAAAAIEFLDRYFYDF